MSWRVRSTNWDFEIQTDHLISVGQSDIIIINKKKELAELWTLLYRVKFKESKKKDKYLDLARELKKLRNVKVSVVPNIVGALGTVTNGLIKGWRTLNKRSSGDIPNYNIIEIGQNIEKGPGDLRRLLSLKLQWKTIR